jgi:hypothetical protein
MNRKDYNLIADTIIELRTSGISSGTILKKVIDKLVVILSDKLYKTYPNFNKTRFINKIYGK